MSSPKKGTIKLPRLRTKDELLKTSPEIFSKLLLGEDMSSARSTTPQTNKTIKAAQSTVPSALGRATSASRAGQLAAYDTPRGFGDEPLTVDQELAIELESVKRERQQLLESISQVKAESGTAGGEAQQADIRQLLKELELKKAKLNELKGDSRRTEGSIAKMRDDDTDAQRLTPDDCVQENAYIQGLRDETTRVEDDLLEADAKNRLYYLLGERTRREHMAVDQKVREKQDSKHACLEDLANLTEHFNATRAAKELAEKELAKTKRQVDEARSDWMRKIRERRAEVRELKKRQQKEREKEVKRREKQLDKDKADRAAQAKLLMEQEAYQLQVAALAPKLEAMEASWNRLRAISGAETPNEVVEYWQGLKAKEQRMRDLVALAEKREAACKGEISQLLASRSAMFESSKAAAAVAAAAAAAAQEAAEKAMAEGAQGDEGSAAAAARIEAAEKRMDAAQVQFSRLRSICVAAEQGLRSMLQRLMIALEEIVPAALPSAAQTLRSPSGVQAAVPVLSQSGAALGAAGSRLQSAGASSTAGSHAADGARRSTNGAAIGSRQGRVTREYTAAAVEPALASKAHRLNSNRGRDTRSAASAASESPAAALTGNLAMVAEDASAAPHGMDKAAQVTGLPLTGLGLSSGAPSARPMLPSRGRNTIDDDTFFDSLAQLLSQVTERLEKLLAAGEGLDYHALRAAAAAAESSCTSGGSAGPTPRVLREPSTAGAPQQAAAAADSAHEQAADAAGAAVESAAAAAAASDADDEAEQGEGSAAADDDEAAAGGEEAADDEVADAAADAEGGTGTAAEGQERDGGGAADQDDQQTADVDQPHADADDAGGNAEAEEAAGADGSNAAASMAAAAQQDAHTAGADAPVRQPEVEAEHQSAQQQPKPSVSVSGAGTSPAVNNSSSRPTSATGAAEDTTAAGSAATVVMAPAVPAAALAVGGNVNSSIPESEKALMKGLYRRTWTGAPWLDAVSDNPLDLNLVPSMKRKKGKKKQAAAAPDLSRILGYTPPHDVPAESESDAESAASEEGNAADGVVDRDWIKMRAAKMTARHNAKQAAAAAAAQQGSGR